jgi:dTDP-L-rhamnose 4-epimerase
MKTKVLITGGAGFIGSHLGEELVRRGNRVRILDSIATRVRASGRPPSLHPEIEWLDGDVRDGAVVAQALEGVSAVVHLAAAATAGDGLFESERCVSVNYVGTAVLVDCLRRRPVDCLVLGSSMTVYGEGLYRDQTGALREIRRRSPDQLRRGIWDAESGSLTPVPTLETKTPTALTVYARSKFDQERVCLRFGRLSGIRTAILRLFNVYGPGQAPSNLYTGNLSTFLQLLRRGRRPVLPEDGEQLRDFVHIRDAVEACRLAIESPTARGIINVGSGRACSLAEAARTLADAAGRADLAPQLSGRYDVAEVRHCFADTSRAEQRLNFRAQIGFREGFAELAGSAEKGGERIGPKRSLELVSQLPQGVLP